MALTIIPAATLTSCSDDDDNDSKEVTLSKFTINQTAATLTPGETLNVTAGPQRG